MRYFLLVLGFLGIGLGMYGFAFGPAGSENTASMALIVGAIFFAIGGATVDIVEEIRRKDRDN